MPKIMRFEAFSTNLEEYSLQVSEYLKRYNIFPQQMAFLLNQYSDEIKKFHSDGRYSKDLADRIAKELRLGSGGMMQMTLRGGRGWQNIYYK